VKQFKKYILWPFSITLLVAIKIEYINFKNCINIFKKYKHRAWIVACATAVDDGITETQNKINSVL